MKEAALDLNGANWLIAGISTFFGAVITAVAAILGQKNKDRILLTKDQRELIATLMMQNKKLAEDLAEANARIDALEIKLKQYEEK